MSLLVLLLVGFGLGLKHATEADHLAAVATLASGRHTLAQSLRLGAAWGLGHALTLILLGGLVMVLGKSIAPLMAQALELAVACMLIALGLDVLRHMRLARVYSHVHDHGPAERHLHAHSHATEPPGPRAPVRHRSRTHGHGHRMPLRALAIGMMHGMAGSAALILLSLDAARSWTTALAYVVVFGLGSIAGMAVLSLAIVVPLRWSLAHRFGWLHNGMTASLGLFSCALGSLIVYRASVLAMWPG